jgi:hypothetical protein
LPTGFDVRSLLVSLDDVRVAELRSLRVAARFAERTALAEEVPQLVETNLEQLQATMLVVAQAALRATFVELVLLGDELLDAVVNLVVVH